MRLYVEEGGEKLYLEYIAPTRQDLLEIIGKNDFYVKNRKYSVNQVYAEIDPISSPAGIIAGATVGTLFLPFLGSIIGGIAGYTIANSKVIKEIENVKNFNRSSISTDNSK